MSNFSWLMLGKMCRKRSGLQNVEQLTAQICSAEGVIRYATIFLSQRKHPGSSPLPAEKKCNTQKRRKRRHRNTKTRGQRNQSALEAPRDNAQSVPFLPKGTEQENFRKEHVLECGYCKWQRESMLDRCEFGVLRAKMVAIFTMRQCQHLCFILTFG